MKSVATFILLLTTTAGCQTIQLSVAENDAVRAAEAFVARNGYTMAGHPKDLPVEHVEIFDGFSTDAELLEQRKALLEPFAIGIEDKGEGVYWVYFASIGRPRMPRIVVVQNGQAWQVFHQSYGPPGRNMKRIRLRPVSPNNRVESARTARPTRKQLGCLLAAHAERYT